ncbi:MAG: (2Fe-2S) ferredoxin domain-containing protein [Methylocystaceae bacterium]|jgi:NADH:ubiquinone oxidoreductase subunit E|nr:(2Fe-2S) ferredoxin domain-containing protein [Methylocystaceae bacterium]
MICVGERCDARGRARQKLCEIESALATRFNAALANGDIKISTRDCLRLCTTAPVIRLEPSGDVYAGIEINELLIEINKTLAGERS